jgi:toxin FitB
MFLPDINVVSDLMRAQPALEVADWMSRQPAELLFTATICQAEILAGIAVMPEGRRRLGLETAAWAMFTEDFADRVLAFDAAAAVAMRRCPQPVVVSAGQPQPSI